jgi:hypothetical protein
MAPVPVGHLTRVRAEIWSEIGADGAALRADEQPLYVNVSGISACETDLAA